MVKTASGGGKTENELAKDLTVGDSKVINPLLLAEKTDQHQCGSFQYATNRKQADNMKASPKSQCYGHRHIQ